jgi:DNA-binding response OmpR family regulator
MSVQPLQIVMVEDNEVLRTLTMDYLLSRGHAVKGYPAAESLDDAVRGQKPSARAHIYLLDVNLPGEDGLSLARRIRSEQPDAGIIMMTARTSELDKISGYEVGADIYLPKPCSLEQLNAAIGALGRRVQSGGAEGGDAVASTAASVLSFSLKSLEVEGPNGAAQLTGTEGRLLDAFCQADSGLLTYEALAKLLGRVYSFKDWQVFAVNVTRLRKKLIEVGAPERCLVSVRSVGYQCCIRLTRR